MKDLSSNALHVTLDVKSLHTNIPHKERIEACRKALNWRAVLQPPTEDLLNLIFSSSFPPLQIKPLKPSSSGRYIQNTNLGLQSTIYISSFWGVVQHFLHLSQKDVCFTGLEDLMPLTVDSLFGTEGGFAGDHPLHSPLKEWKIFSESWGFTSLSCLWKGGTLTLANPTSWYNGFFTWGSCCCSKHWPVRLMSGLCLDLLSTEQGCVCLSKRHMSFESFCFIDSGCWKHYLVILTIL